MPLYLHFDFSGFEFLNVIVRNAFVWSYKFILRILLFKLGAIVLKPWVRVMAFKILDLVAKRIDRHRIEIIFRDVVLCVQICFLVNSRTRNTHLLELVLNQGHTGRDLIDLEDLVPWVRG